MLIPSTIEGTIVLRLYFSSEITQLKSSVPEGF